MLGAQCVCEKKGLGVQKYRSALHRNPFTFSCKEAVELQGCRYRCPSFPPWKNEPVWSVMDYAAGALAVPSREAQPFSSRGCQVVYRRLVIAKCLRVGFPRVAWLPLPHGTALHRLKGAKPCWQQDRLWEQLLNLNWRRGSVSQTQMLKLLLLLDSSPPPQPEHPQQTGSLLRKGLLQHQLLLWCLCPSSSLTPPPS